ncbi:hypothetical protein ACQZ46_11465 [Agrobacterium salinitolerans]|uniref:hypothetical protein n=1 Tax=Agrobacterium deltaense TaxID=1183412 RepID=UPI003D953D1F
MRIYCTYCGSQLHTFEACPKTWNGSATRLHLRCAYCGSSKHNYEACPKIRSHPAEGGIIIRD